MDQKAKDRQYDTERRALLAKANRLNILVSRHHSNADIQKLIRRAERHR